MRLPGPRLMRVFAMELVTKLFGDLLLFVYHCFDRIVIHGYLSGLSRPEQLVHFFRKVVGIPVLSKEIRTDTETAPARQQVAEPCPQTDQVHSLALDVLGAVLAAVHEQREIEAGNHIGRKLSEIGILERGPGVLIPAAPQEPRREAAPQRGVAEQAAPAAVEGCLVRG